MSITTDAQVSDLLPFVKETLDKTDLICSLIPEHLLDWRPADPSGRFSFSLGEIAIHIGDSRRSFARVLSGNNTEGGYLSDFLPQPENGSNWRFKPASKTQIMEHLASARLELEEWLYKPADQILESTEASRARFERHIAKLESDGKNTSEALRRGPVSINRTLAYTATHESGHRGSLQTLLRSHGINVGGE